MNQRSLFDSFNARSLDPVEIGQNYIFSSDLVDVAQHSNTVVLGPRGSGKTTLLKMLTLPALHSWKSPKLAEVLKHVDYYTIFIPTDFTWYPEFRRPISGEFDKSVDELLSNELFRSHVKLSICDTLSHIQYIERVSDPRFKKFQIKKEIEDEKNFFSLLGADWNLKIEFGGIFGLRRAITQQIKVIQREIAYSATRAPTVESLLNDYDFFGGAFYDDLNIFLELFRHFFGSQRKFAACFDEVEIAPENVKKSVWQSTRSFNQDFLIKFSASPYDVALSSIFGYRMPMNSHDFNLVDLTDQKKKKVIDFSEKFLAAICQDIGIKQKVATAVLGSSTYTADPDEIETDENNLLRLEPGGLYHQFFVRLAKKDKSFANYLDEKKIDLQTMHLESTNRQAAIRKLIAPVVVREQYFFESDDIGKNSSKRTRRLSSLKSLPPLYTGAESIFQICEGNPRWLLGMLRPLLADAKSGKLPVSRSRQSERIRRSVSSLMMLLSTYGDDKLSPHGITLVQLIDDIGKKLTDGVLSDAFDPEPALTFRVDQKLNERIMEMIGLAVNQGAMIILPQAEPVRPGDISGRRVRLSYLLAPRYKLPLVRGRSVSLSGLVFSEKGASIRQSEQLLLDDLFENDI